MSDKSVTGSAFYAVVRPTIWQRMGFGECRAFHPDVDNKESGFAPGWHIVEVRIHLDWKDRLRALVSGNLMVESCLKTDVAIGRSEATTAFSVLSPGTLKP